MTRGVIENRDIDKSTIFAGRFDIDFNFEISIHFQHNIKITRNNTGLELEGKLGEKVSINDLTSLSSLTKAKSKSPYFFRKNDIV